MTSGSHLSVRRSFLSGSAVAGYQLFDHFDYHNYGSSPTTFGSKLAGAIAGTPLRPATAAPAPVTVKEIGIQLMGPHAAALLVAGLLLTVALLGAIVIAATERSGDRRNSP